MTDGRLDRRARCLGLAGATGAVEEVRWRSPVPGRYRVGVDVPEACDGRATDAPYRLVIDVGARRDEHTGTARLLVREPAVLEAVVP